MKHPDTIAWEEWLKSEEAAKCLEGRTEGKYLKNRLWYAFMAGRQSLDNEIALEETK